MKRSWDDRTTTATQQQLLGFNQQQQQPHQQRQPSSSPTKSSSNNNKRKDLSLPDINNNNSLPPSSSASHWPASMNNHPYASAYSNMASFGAQQHRGGSGFDPAAFAAAAAVAAASTATNSGQPDAKRPRTQGSENKDGDSDDDDDDDDDNDSEDNESAAAAKLAAAAAKPNRKIVKGPDGKPKVKLTRGSRACIACRKIKMRCIPDEGSGPNGPCKRCKSGGHECIFEESNRGKRSTRKNEALAAKIQKMEQALKGIGSALSHLDQGTIHAFSNALHSAAGDPEVINLITSHTTAPSLAAALNRSGFNFAGNESGVRGEDSAPGHRPPLSPRLHSLPDNVLSPLGLLAEASLQNTDSATKKHGPLSGRNGNAPLRPSPLSLGTTRNGTAGQRHATSDLRGGPEVGVAASNYFKPGGIGVFTGADDRVPELLTIVTREEIEELFDIYFKHMSPHVPLIYKDFHTPDLVLQRSQFLCTVICALAARYYTKRPELHGALSVYAKRLSFEVPSRGYKSVEVCQAYLLLSMWTLGPEKTFEQDRTWLMLGMAIRMATDLNLHRKSVMSGLDTREGRERDLEIINRERCWLMCFVLDRSVSAQMGKPYTLREDYIIRHACEASWHQQRYSLYSDHGLAAYVVLQQIMSRAIDSIYSSTTTVSGLREDCDYMLIVRSAHEELRRWLHDWNRGKNSEIVTDNGGIIEYDSRAQFYYAYSSLVLYSFGLENALERAKMDITFFLTNVYEAATRVCTVVKEMFLKRGYLPYLPDTNFVMCSYALLSLLKLLKPELKPYHDCEEAIFATVTEVADILEDCAVDPSHQPAIYAAFIREIVRKTKDHRRGPSTHPSRQVSRAGSPMPNGSGTVPNEHMFDPALIGEGAWPSDMLSETQFAFIPQGGDMMIMPSAAGPSESVQNSPTAQLGGGYPTAGTPQASNGWAEYLPTFMSADAFDGWDGSMLLPGFGRGQMTLSGGLLHSQFGSGIITPLGRSPAQSRAASRAASRAQSPVGK